MRITVTGGASFIGSHLCEALVAEGHDVYIMDDLSSGSLDNLSELHKQDVPVRVLECNLRTWQPNQIAMYLENFGDVVYHLAADHGGRGYVETQQVATSNNFAIDNNVFQACKLAGVKKIILASSGCVYPLNKQKVGSEKYLHENEVGPPYDPDGLYGLAKLAGELTLKQLWAEDRIPSVSCRFFTVYGPRAKENHAIISFIARAFIRQDPWVIWGDGTQVRNWTYVDDIVKGLMLAKNLHGCQALNLGTEERITVDEAVRMVLDLVEQPDYNERAQGRTNYEPMIDHDLTKPVGPMVRVADNSKYINLGGDAPLPFKEGLRRTMDWYYETHNTEDVWENLDRLLVARK